MQYIHTSQVRAENFKALKAPSPMTARSGDQYTTTQIGYNYGTPQQPFWSQALFENNIGKAVVKRNKKGNLKLNIYVTDEPDLVGMKQVDIGNAAVVGQFKDPFGVFDFDPARPSGLRTCAFKPRDEKTGKIIEGSPFMMSLKHNELSKYLSVKPVKNPDGTPAMDDRGMPLYTEQPIDYSKLEGKELTCSVVWCNANLYHNSGMPLPRLYVRSCVVFAISDKGAVEHTTSNRVRDFLMQNPAMLEAMAADWEKMQKGQTVSLFDKAPQPSSPQAPQMLALQAPQIPALQAPQMPALQAPQIQASQGPPPSPPAAQPTPSLPQMPPAPAQFGSPQFTPLPSAQFQVTPAGTLDMNSYLQQQMATGGLSVTKL